jgi:5'-nucleotidase
MDRRRFLQQAAYSTSAIAAAQLLPTALLANPVDANEYSLTILHTNDVHSRLEAFPMDGTRNQGLGGVAARAAIIKDIRSAIEQVLVFDAGDIFQGTPYFNMYKGEPEMKAMQAMGYDAATMGNHDFDAGLENFANQLVTHGRFPILVANYDFTNTPMEHLYQPYKIFKRGKLRIGVFGIGIEGKGLIPDELFGNTIYQDPIVKANETADYLKKQKNCDMIICLSHLGYRYADKKVSDVVLAKETGNINLIIGGHTHTFMEEPLVVRNKIGGDTIINQVGWGGIQLGRLDFNFSKTEKKNSLKAHTVILARKTSE